MLDLTHRQRTVITTSSAVLDSAAGPQASTAPRAFRLTRANRPARCGARMGISSVSVSRPPAKLRCVPISPSSRKSPRVVPLNPICAAPCCVIPVSACARQRGPSFWGTGVQPSLVAPHLIGPRAMPILAGPTSCRTGAQPFNPALPRAPEQSIRIRTEAARPGAELRAHGAAPHGNAHGLRAQNHRGSTTV